MRVFVRPTGLHSRAMIRVANALADYAPPSVEIVGSPKMADLVVSHVIGPDPAPEQPEVIIQYCLASAGASLDHWLRRWSNARLVWSYYDLPAIVNQNGFPFYHAPLGVDTAFTTEFTERLRRGVMTSGYVSAPAGEAIEEVVMAAWMLDLPVLHLGPLDIAGMRMDRPANLTSVLGVDDARLAEHYQNCAWVSGLRHVEGFELPVVEGLCCGARPIVFDRPDMRQWYLGHAVFVPECGGTELVKHLLDVMGDDPEPVDAAERAWARERFAWGPIVREFWRCVGA